MTGRATLPPLLAAAVVAAAGCGSPGASERPAAAAPDAVPRPCGQVPPALQGSYYARTARADLPPELVDAPVGLHLLLIGPEHHLFLRVGTRGDHGWPACVTRGRLWVPASDAGECAGRGAAVYRWRRRGEILRLTRLQDRCLPRVHALTVRAYRWFNASGWDCHSIPNCDHKVAQVLRLEATGSCAAIGCSEVP